MEALLEVAHHTNKQQLENHVNRKKMKQIAYFILCILFSCSIKKNEKPYKKSTSSIDNLTKIERNIVDDFLESELASDRYKYYKDYQLVVIMESLPKKKAIESYLYTQRELLESKGLTSKKEDTEKFFFLDSLEIKKINSELENETIYHWKISDFNKKVSIVSDKKIIEMTNTGEYLNFSQRLIIYLSKPLVLGSKKAFISFSVSIMPFNPISHFSVLMINENNKWVQSVTYFDGIYY